jgi:hypothetical protein
MSLGRAAHSFVLIAVLAALGCDDSSKSPVGSYKATTFVTTSAGAPRDELANGASFSVVLAPDGATSGHAQIPATPTSPAFDADLAGTWTLTDSTITLTHAADTFIRDMPFRVRGKTLVGDQTFALTRIQVTLTRD